MSEKGGLLSRFFAGVDKGLPTPQVGSPTYPQVSARRMEGRQSKSELEKISRDGSEVEGLMRMPGWLRYYSYLCEQREKCRNQLATEDFGAANDRLKAVQLRLATLEECARWAEEEVAAGKHAGEQLIGGK